MKKTKCLTLSLLVLIIVTALCSCHTPKEKKSVEGEDRRDSFIILHSPEAVDRQIANAVASMLEHDGRMARIFATKIPENESIKDSRAVITVGRSVSDDFSNKKTDIPHIYCHTDGGGAETEDISGIAPTVESSALGDSAMVLLPKAENFSIISTGEGGADVRSACDLFDRTGKDYTVELLDGRIYGEVLLSCLESDTDALILPAGALGNKNASAYALPYIPESDIPVIAVGMGEPLKGALATFCIDSDATSKALYSLINSEIYGHTPTYPENYYVLCINKELAATLDERAIKNITELFPVVWVE